MESVRGKVAVITGASGGIGEGTAVLLAQYGSWLTLTGRNEARLKTVVQRCVTAGCSTDHIVAVVGDLRESHTRQQILEKTLTKFGRIDILVNNAGMLSFADSLSTTQTQYDDVMDVNLKAPFLLTQLIAPELIKTKGNIVNISSIGSTRPMPEVGVYCMSKAALDMMTKCLALELAPHGVRVNSVNPGSVISLEAERVRHGRNEEKLAKYLESQKAKHPLHEVGSPEDVAHAVAFLASDMSRFITGELVFVDGGRQCVSVGVRTPASKSSTEKE